MDPIKQKELISQYKTAHPDLGNKTDMEIISIMRNDSSVKKEDVAQLSALLSSNSEQLIGDSSSFATKAKTRTGGGDFTLSACN